MGFIISSFLLSLKTVALVRPGAETSQPAQRLMSNPLSSSVMSAAPLSSSLPSPLPSTPVRTPATHTLSPASHSKLTASNGTSALKLSALSQGSVPNSSTQESSQDKQAEQAKLVRPANLCFSKSCLIVFEYLNPKGVVWSKKEI